MATDPNAPGVDEAAVIAGLREEVRAMAVDVMRQRTAISVLQDTCINLADTLGPILGAHMKGDEKALAEMLDAAAKKLMRGLAPIQQPAPDPRTRH